VYVIVGLLFLTASLEIGWAAGDYISPATVPPSVRREGLVRSPTEVDGAGNLLITGNIRGPAFFRGIVPYSSPANFGVTLPSSSFDSFLRDSAGTESFSRYNNYSTYPLGYRPYYSPTQTVASATLGTSAVTREQPANAIDPYSAQYYLAGTLPPRRYEELDTATARSLARWRPMSMTPTEMEKLIDSEIAKESPGRLTEQYQPPTTEQYEPGISQESYETGKLNEPLSGLESSLLVPPVQAKPAGEVNLPFGTPIQTEQPGEETAETTSGALQALGMNNQLDVYDLMKQQFDLLQKKIDLQMAAEQAQKAATSAEGEDVNKPAKGQTQQTSQAEKLAETYSTVARTKSILGPFETFASYAEDKFNRNMRAAETYLKQGKYYRAADAYTLASLYKPNDPLAYAGKSHALFASGEYMSSALFLSKALQIFPEYADFKIDLVAMVGSRDQLETRVADAEEWLKRSGAPELQFLLAYVYYQMDRLAPAKKAIEAASKMMPDDTAVLALKKAIESSSPPADNDISSSMRITDGTKPVTDQPWEKKQ
jgi:tetratricopeptide (TPR) repeat protein